MVNQNKVGLVFAFMLGGIHVVWSLLVLLGWAQPLYNFILWAHMVHLSFVIGPFEAKAALTVIVIAAVLGYIIGWIAAWVWNRVHRS